MSLDIAFDNEPMFDVETWYEDDDRTIAFVVLQGLGNKVRNTASTTKYEVISGAGIFQVGNTVHPVIAGDTVTVGVGVPYQDCGNLVMLATSEPPFNPDAVELIEENTQK